MDTDGYSIQLLKIPVSDIEVSSTFYAEKFSLELEFSAPEYGWAQLNLKGVPIALYCPGMGGGDGHIGGSVDFHLSLPGGRFEVLAEKLLACGNLVDNRIHTGGDGTTFIDVEDPDGNILKIFKR